ncbi:MAG TPA: hypothetical protein VLH77_04230 [Gammaproteobacteria bacterium]|nr:hypothetical protein [Gammaproteobacteria bacterium]
MHRGEGLKLCECGAGFLNESDKAEHVSKKRCAMTSGPADARKRRLEEQNVVAVAGSKRQKTAK